MIISKVPAADKSFRIYRPNEKLEDICRTNGANIVRTMIPCFNGEDSEKYSYVYGINVRTPRVNSILPFSTAYKYDWSTGKGEIKDDLGLTKDDIKYKVPEFTDEFSIREILIQADIKGQQVCPDDITIMSLTTERELEDTEFNELKSKLTLQNGFFLMQAHALGLKKRAYMWLTSEDFNVNTGGEALSNIIAISDDFDAIVNRIMPHRLEFINLLFLIKARYLFDAEIAQRKTAISSAKAAIMARNMSHNLGSHVMAYLKQHLNSVQDMVRDNVLSSIFTEEDIALFAEIDDRDKRMSETEKWFERVKKRQEGLGGDALPFLVGLGKFISYLQERQDFIATIATSYIPYFSAVNFKDFVYDELNPDLRYKRHQDRRGLEPDNILLGNIARSEGLARRTNPTQNKNMSNIIIKYKEFDGEPVLDTKTGKLLNGKGIKEKAKALQEMRGFMVHLPGGVVGRQAIFSIVENVIRNAAKHGHWGESSDKNLELTFNKFSLEDIMNRRVPSDFAPEGEEKLPVFLKKYYAGALDIKDLYVVTLTDNLPFEKNGTTGGECTNLEAIRRALIEPYIDRHSVEMLQTNKGIKEMRISAAWMRGVEDDVKINPLYIKPNFGETDNEKDKEDHWIMLERPELPEHPSRQQLDDYNNFKYKYWNKDKTQWVGIAPVLMVRACADKEDEDFHLQYIFCLPKPKEVAIVIPDIEWEQWGTIESGERKNKTVDNLSNLMWSVYPVSQFLDTANKSFEFILLDEGLTNEEVNQIRMLSPNRVFKQSDIIDILNIRETIINGDYSTIDSKITKRIKEELFKKLCDFDPKNDKIVISDSKTKARIPQLEHKPDNVIIKDGVMLAKYLYRTHNETEINFAEYLDATRKFKDSVFVEGITGNNSTDRLVRNDEIDSLWMYRHLHAMKTSVGIFDERLFSKIFKKDEADIALRPLSELKDDYYAEMELDEILDAQSYKDLERITGKDLSHIKGNYMAIAYEKKGVGVFNMIKTKDGLDIYGYSGLSCERHNSQSGESGLQGMPYFAIIEKIGEIRRVIKKNGKKGQIKITRIKNKAKFDYVTIHQGLLDKVYEQFDIRHNDYEKHLFTKSFYEAFCKDSSNIEYRDERIMNAELPVFFLPNLRIHSGRSKPSFADMPQKQPFIQYAAIEHAVMDCKYSLVELLDFARYEKEDNGV